MYRHNSFYCTALTLLCFADTVFFNKLKVCRNPALSKSVGAIFPTAFAHSVSLCHILVVLLVFQVLLLYSGDLWLVDITIVIVLGCHKSYLCNTVNLNVMCSDCPSRLSPQLLPLLRLPYSLRHTIQKLGQLITLLWLLSHTFLSLNQKLWNDLSLIRKACQKPA